MNILFLSTWFPFPPDNGSRIRAYYLARALAQEHQLTIVAFQPELSAGLERPSWACRENVTIYPVRDDPFRYTHLPGLLRYLSPVPLAAWPHRVMEQQINEIAGSHRWDVVVALQLPVSTYALQINHVPHLLDIDVSLSYQRYLQFHQVARGIEQTHEWLGWQKSWQYERRICRHFDICTVVLEEEAEYLRHILEGTPCQVMVSENGVDMERNCLGAVRQRRNGLIYTGALTYEANLDAVEYFLRAIYPLIRKEQPEIVFSITGSTKDVNLARLPLDPSVRLTGYLNDPRPEIRRSAVCVVPIRQGTGTRLKVLEAMALGTPVVSTNKGIEGLDVIHGRHLLIADDPARFAQYTLQLLRDRALGERLAMNARHLVEDKYDWKRICDCFLGLIEDAVADRQRKHHAFETRLSNE